MITVLVYPHRSKVDNPYLEDLTLSGATMQFEDWTPKRALRSSFDVFHVHWPESVWSEESLVRSVLRGMAFLGAAGWLKLRGTKIVLTVHNLQPHENERPRLNSVLTRVFDRLVDRVQILAESSRTPVARRIGREVPIDFVPMGSFVDNYGPLPEIERQDRILHFGSIRPYKNTPTLLRTLSASETEWEVMVCGHCSEPELSREIEDLARDDDRILLNLGKVPETAVPSLHAESRLAVLPFTTIENSSTVMLALSLRLPVLAPRQGSLPELQRVVGDDWLRLYDGAFSVEILDQGIAWAQQLRTGKPDLSPYSWDAVRSTLEASYWSALGSSVVS